MLFLVSHAPGGLLPTIRSRCRRLRFDPWAEGDVADFVRARTAASEEDALRLARMAQGAPGRALALAVVGALGIDEAAHALLRGLPAGDASSLQALSESFRGGEGAERFQLLFERLADQVREAAVTGVLQGGAGRRALGRRLGHADPPAARGGRGEPRPRRLLLDRHGRPPRRGASLSRRMLIDSHVNLHAPQYDDDREAVIERARAAGVARMVTICDKVSSFPAVLAVAQAHDDIWCSVGTHPHEAKENPRLEAGELIRLADHERVVGIGETGLDFHYDLSPRAVQADVFRAHIAAARDTGLPLIVHSRLADEVMAEILESEYAAGRYRLLLHCYTSGPELARRAAALGAYFSVSGIATFKAASEVRAVIADMPADRVIVETDCPYLAPVPMRGRRNEPAFLPHILAKLAEIRGWSVAEAEARTEDAFFTLFDRIARP